MPLFGAKMRTESGDWEKKINCTGCWLVLLFVAIVAFADTTTVPQDTTKPMLQVSAKRAPKPNDLWATDLARPVANKTFGPGERLVYDVEFGAVTAGQGSLEILSFETVNGHTSYHFRAEAKSSKGFDYIYKVRDRMDSYVDSTMFIVHKFMKRLREGNYKDDKVVSYDHATRKATMVTAGKENRITEFDTLAVDVLSSLYFLRQLSLEVGKPAHIPVHDIDKKYPLLVEVQKKETISVPAGKFDCIKVEPKLESEGIFKRKGRIWVWLTDDERHVPVMMASELPFGAIHANLVEYRQGTPTGKK